MVRHSVSFVASIVISKFSFCLRSPLLGHTSSRNVAPFGHDRALVLTTRYHRDPLAARLGCLLLNLGDRRSVCRGARRPWHPRQTSRVLGAKSRPRASRLLYLLLFDYHGALYRSSATIACGRGLLSLGMLALGTSCVLEAVLLRPVLLARSGLGVVHLLVSELAHSLVGGPLLVQFGSAGAVGSLGRVVVEDRSLCDALLPLVSKKVLRI